MKTKQFAFLAYIKYRGCKQILKNSEVILPQKFPSIAKYMIHNEALIYYI